MAGVSLRICRAGAATPLGTRARLRRDAVTVVRPKAAAFAAFLPVRAEHVVIDDALRAPGKQIGHGFVAVGTFFV
jgi:hypothetical protein